ncbi:hypothetical protein TCAL_11022 [Tigriopus californicus]|uniref:FAM234A/B beta-propeller domain-containing protein n=2 Tax=Tigriopus californicus TaxID=6832 RepID=A0A553NVA3_TIGCA|nr:hypothetical protein TCAL_11022 [Tigriopus californicus]|eukprot:TCALIF_11022-PA protein Name:"Protein of unknown function" AED:0.00 eAED:0.00 QI:91/1/1/1/0.75/0.8/5/62/717
METTTTRLYPSACPRTCPWFFSHQLSHLSTSRKWSFLISVLACACLVGVFLWGVPCSTEDQVCRSPGSDFESTRIMTGQLALSGDDGFFDPATPAALQQRMTDWSRKFTRIVLTSGLHVTRQPPSQNADEKGRTILVSGFVSGDSHRGNNQDAGLIGLEPRKGRELWRRALYAPPKQMDCHYLDVNSDGVKDCLVIGDKGLLAAIDPVRGEQLWFLHHHIPLVNLSLPRFLPDLNDDGIPELLSSCAVTLPSGISDHREHVRTNLVIISGQDGTVIGRPYLVEMCLDIGAVNITTHLNIQFDCLTRNGPDQFEMTTEELFQKISHQELPMSILERNGAFGEYYQFSKLGVDHQETEKDSIHLDIVPLREESPELGVTVKIWDGFAHRTIWNHTWHHAVAFQPVSTRFETDRWDSPIEGFVFRLWQWPDNTSDTFTLGRQKPQDDEDDKKEKEPIPAAHLFNSQSNRGRSKTTGGHAASHPPEGEEEEEEDTDYAYDIVFKHANPQSSYDQNEDDDYYTRNQKGSHDWIASVIPFGGGGRRLMSWDRGASAPTRHFRPTTAQPKKEGDGHVGPWPLERSLRIQESIYYIVLNHTTPHLQRIFSHHISQVCSLTNIKKGSGANEKPQQSRRQQQIQPKYLCQPHFDTQPNSMVIIAPDLGSPDANEWRDLVFSSQFWGDQNGDFVDSSEYSQSQDSPSPLISDLPHLRTLLKKLRLFKT